VGKSERKKPVGYPRCKYKDAIKIGIRDIRCKFVHWTCMEQGKY
jgi:hypothetical protein